MFHSPNQYRVRNGPMGSDDSEGNNGAFVVELAHGQKLVCIAANGMGWEHVAIALEDRCPTSDEMRQVKEIFWDCEDHVVQFYSPETCHAESNPFCLYLWRPTGGGFPRPSIFIR